MKLQVIQEIIGGVADCPLLFTDEAKATETFFKLARENEYDGEDNLEEVQEYFEFGDYEIKYWVTELDSTTEIS